ncbi:bacillithiol biosynthesis cysteine-adding enzyme BshC [Anaerobacillus sp. CMMVII]|uniref:bacillithiol biosynthesis cysteine-adding enzyme BshC n=1 Tax=Anaerobacillus sp. CMMVII TaxID=2755588 RepID=UPI0021B7F7CC|nr:bacillithiol biosynthesis cysteine-adding enzyme BshC [Anaerobacillus sp. CMMVII]MCT8139032.1 bacillithiol biosynthesis cysteine-adding enzyme BshC [Anaerobacillus sp. CMMVII]
MLLEECQLNHSKLMKDYLNSVQPLQTFFDYSYKNQGHYFERQMELKQRSFQREALTEHLLEYNKKYHCSSETVTNIEKLLDENAVAVVGGQQAGVLTGPLYTIHKIITILKLAKIQEAKLSVPVVPVFWIAGEDHDFDEINHIYSVGSGKLQKRRVNQENNRKRSVSDLELDKEAIKDLVLNVMVDSNESKNTGGLLKEINDSILTSETYVDFFSSLIHKLFKRSGIVLINSHHKQVRTLEIPFLKELVENNRLVNDCFLDTADSLVDNDYGEPIERTENNAHLFYHFQGTRLLLERNNQGLYIDKQQLCSFTKEELLSLIEQEPENFSNNVVTRPLMQEFLLPVLAFVAGPGEIAYWASLKKVFHLFGYKVPPVVPRLSITLVEPQIAKWLNEDGSAVAGVVSEGLGNIRRNIEFWEKKASIDETVQKVLSEVEKAHRPLRDLVIQYDKGLEQLAHKNEQIIKKEIAFLAQKVEKSVRQNYDHQWLKFDLIEANIRPIGGLQERSLNIVRYLNDYGLDFVVKLAELPFELNDNHKLVYLN